MRQQQYLQVLKKNLKNKFKSNHGFDCWGNSAWNDLAKDIVTFVKSPGNLPEKYLKKIEQKTKKKMPAISGSTVERIFKSGTQDEEKKPYDEYDVEEPLHPSKRFILDVLSLYATKEMWSDFTKRLAKEGILEDQHEAILEKVKYLTENYEAINGGYLSINFFIGRTCDKEFSRVADYISKKSKYKLSKPKVIAQKIENISSLTATVKAVLWGYSLDQTVKYQIRRYELIYGKTMDVIYQNKFENWLVKDSKVLLETDIPLTEENL